MKDYQCKYHQVFIDSEVGEQHVMLRTQAKTFSDIGQL